MKLIKPEKALNKDGLQMTLSGQIRRNRKPIGRQSSVQIAFDTSSEPMPMDTVLGMLLEAYAKQKSTERKRPE